MISMSQENFATVLKTVATTVSNRRYVFPHITLNLMLQRLQNRRKLVFFLKKNIDLKPILLTVKKNKIILMAY
jgi:hypothetical protein